MPSHTSFLTSGYHAKIQLSPDALSFSAKSPAIHISPITEDQGIDAGDLGTWTPPEIWLRSEEGNRLEMSMAVKTPVAAITNAIMTGKFSSNIGDWLGEARFALNGGLALCTRAKCDTEVTTDWVRFVGFGKVGLSAELKLAIGLKFKMLGWWWAMDTSPFAKGLDVGKVPRGVIPFLHFGQAIAGLEIGIDPKMNGPMISSIVAGLAAAGVGAIVAAVGNIIILIVQSIFEIEVAGAACLGHICDCARLVKHEEGAAGALPEGCTEQRDIDKHSRRMLSQLANLTFTGDLGSNLTESPTTMEMFYQYASDAIAESVQLAETDKVHGEESNKTSSQIQLTEAEKSAIQDSDGHIPTKDTIYASAYFMLSTANLKFAFNMKIQEVTLGTFMKSIVAPNPLQGGKVMSLHDAITDFVPKEMLGSKTYGDVTIPAGFGVSGMIKYDMGFTVLESLIKVQLQDMLFVAAVAAKPFAVGALLSICGDKSCDTGPNAYLQLVSASCMPLVTSDCNVMRSQRQNENGPDHLGFGAIRDSTPTRPSTRRTSGRRTASRTTSFAWSSTAS